MTLHKFGAMIGGLRGSFAGTIDDEEFAEVTKYGLPAGWWAWHVEESELDPPSSRVAEIRKVPQIMMDGQVACWRTAWYMAAGVWPGEEPLDECQLEPSAFSSGAPGTCEER